jgi:ATP-dependent Lhr-like helicase
MKQVQVSSGLLYDVFSRYDPENMLLNQAYREVRERQLEQTRLAQALERIGRAKLLHTTPPRPTPLGLPILVDRLRETLSTESLADRIEAMVTKLEQQAGSRPAEAPG